MRRGGAGARGRRPLLLRALVRLYPRSFRERFGEDVLRTLAAARVAARASGVRALVAFWLRNVPNLVGGAVRERASGGGRSVVPRDSESARRAGGDRKSVV